MGEIRAIRDLSRCRELWEQVTPREVVSDLWEVRSAFHQHFQRPAHFVADMDGDRLLGLLPLSWIEEKGCYGYFPGETWQGKTWLEQNRIHANGNLGDLVSGVRGPFHLRYLSPDCSLPETGMAVDETGYLFYPPRYDYDLENWWREFSGKNAKRLRREIESLQALGVRYRLDRLEDFDLLVRLNMGRFGSMSYFHDPRFRAGFYSLVNFLAGQGWLRMTAVLLGGEVAAVDMGCLYRGKYTLLAGGTNPDHPGVAKLINLHHMQRACSERMDEVDFLCGDFKWKPLFHLSPRPLFLMTDAATRAA